MYVNMVYSICIIHNKKNKKGCLVSVFSSSLTNSLIKLVHKIKISEYTWDTLIRDQNLEFSSIFTPSNWSIKSEKKNLFLPEIPEIVLAILIANRILFYLPQVLKNVQIRPLTI